MTTPPESSHVLAHSGDPTSRFSDRWLFFRKFLRYRTIIGSVTPSSRWVARGMLEGIDFRRSAIILELGAGTGSITAELLHSARQQCRVLIVERDADFYVRLRDRFPTVDIIHGDALEIARFLDERQITTVDHVLCELALPWFTPETRHTLLDTMRRYLAPGGSFRQLTYMPWVHTAVYANYFEKIHSRLVLRNLPPAACYICRNPKPV